MLFFKSQLTFYVFFLIHITLFFLKGPNIPEIVLRTVKNNTHEVKYIFELNEDLEEKLENKSVSERMDLTVTVGEDYEAPVVMSLPKDYDPNRKYPLLLYVYGGPGSQLVNQAWKVGWTDYLTSNYGVVYATIDGRGTGFQSNEYKFEVRIRIIYLGCCSA